MPSTSTLMPPTNARPTMARRDVCAVRFATYGAPGEPPAVDEISGDDCSVIEDLYSRAADACDLPPLAVREVIENLVHAGFEGATVSVFDGGASLRVADCGPGIPDKDRALQPGYSTACERIRSVVRGVGSGLPIAVSAMKDSGGTIALEDNLRGGTVVTLSAPDAAVAQPSSDISQRARQLMALLVEMAPTTPAALARELGLSLGECGRELVLLEHRGFVARSGEGMRTLTDSGTALLVTLF